MDDEEDFQGIVCIGGVVRDHTGTADAAVSVKTLKAGRTEDRLAAISDALVLGADEIPAALDYLPAAPASDGPQRATTGRR